MSTPPDDTEAERHEPTPNATCHAERHDGGSGTTHVCRWLAGHDSAAHDCICGYSWEDSFEDRVLVGFAPAFAQAMQPPDAAEGLRERIAEAIAEARCDHVGPLRDRFACTTCRADAVLAVLVEPPGDLREQMAEAMRAHGLLTGGALPDGHGTCVCGHWTGTDWSAHLAEVMASVRWEDAARLAAENARLRAERDHAVGELSARDAHTARWETERAARLRAEQERDEAKAERDAKLRTKALGRSLVEMEGFAQRETARADKAEAKVAEYENALNWQTSCLACSKVLNASIADHDRAEQAERELTELKAGVAEAVRQIRAWQNPDSAEPLLDHVHVPEVERTLKAYIGEHVIAALESRPADPEEIRRLAQATTEEKTDEA